MGASEKIAVVDYGAGNLHSVLGALSRANATAQVVTSPAHLQGADGIILPGVGAFGYAAEELAKSGFSDALIKAAACGTPLLGICLGMQLLFAASEESPGAQGLGILPGRVTLLKTGGLKTPHMGWSDLHGMRGRLTKGVDEGAFVYFVHSFGVHSEDCAAAQANYGETFDAAVERGNVFGTQFHPEKSSAVGARILENFLQYVKEARV
ncbi:MAG: imidazole glycerol phosphate synthase subunit HisH [Clostridiales bacterium]|nr:imidazole glycerol phosphate synthase subunit HisH [Clostridiales bacterium]